MKICITCTPGGHLTEMQYLLEAFNGHEVFYILEDTIRSQAIRDAYLVRLIATPLDMLAILPSIFRILLKESPQVIISTGAEIAIPVFYIGKLLGARTIFVETICRISQPTRTGKLVYPVTDLFLVQHESLLAKYGDKARYEGGMI